MSTECRSLEEYVRGIEGDADRAFTGALRRALEAARLGGQERVQLEVRVTPVGEPSRQEATYTCRSEDSPDACADRLLELLTDSPGEAFAGELRVNFRAQGDSRSHFGSYTRKMRPVAVELPGEGTGADIGDGSSGLDFRALSAAVSLVERLAKVAGDAAEKNVALMAGSASMMGGASTLMVNHARAMGRGIDPTTAPKQTGVVHDLLRGVLKITGAAAGSDSKVGKAADMGAAALEAAAPPPPPGGYAGGVPSLEGGDAPEAGGGGGGGVTDEQAEAWARANPDRARDLAMRLMAGS